MTRKPRQNRRLIAFQGRPGAYSHMACIEAAPDFTPLPCPTFAAALAAVEDGRAARAMIPIDNSIAGRVADIHRLLPETSLSIVGEHFLPVHHCLLAPIGATVKTVKTVISHVHALPQCRRFIEARGLTAEVFGDTGGAAEKVAADGDTTQAAIASALAAEIYGLKILRRNIEDEKSNTTRFVIFSRTANKPGAVKDQPCLTSLVFGVKHRPGALVAALGAFAAHGVNIVKIESYLESRRFRSAFFYAEIDGHPQEPQVRAALDALGRQAAGLRVLGHYAASPWRRRFT